MQRGAMGCKGMQEGRMGYNRVQGGTMGCRRVPGGTGGCSGVHGPPHRVPPTLLTATSRRYGEPRRPSVMARQSAATESLGRWPLYCTAPAKMSTTFSASSSRSPGSRGGRQQEKSRVTPANCRPRNRPSSAAKAAVTAPRHCRQGLGGSRRARPRHGSPLNPPRTHLWGPPHGGAGEGS